MHFSTLALPFMAIVASVSASTITVFSDAKCTKKVQTITLGDTSSYHCFEFTDRLAQGVIFSKAGSFPSLGFNAWDSQYCEGDQAGSVPTLGTCLSAASYGLVSFQSAHISPRNATF